MNKNFVAYQKLKLSDARKFKAGEYVVVVDGKLFRKGKNLVEILNEAQKRHPQDTPLVAKVPHKGVFIFFYD